MLDAILDCNSLYGLAELRDGNSSSPAWCQDIELRNFHCMRKKRRKERESLKSEKPVDYNLLRYEQSMIPRMPSEYSHALSPIKRQQIHVLQSKFRLWQFKKNPLALGAKPGRGADRSHSPDQVNASNASLERSSTQLNRSKLAAASSSCFIINCNCCDRQLDVAPEHAIVHMAPTDCQLVNEAAVAMRVQVERALPARRIQLDADLGHQLDHPNLNRRHRSPAVQAAAPTTSTLSMARSTPSGAAAASVGPRPRRQQRRVADSTFSDSVKKSSSGSGSGSSSPKLQARRLSTAFSLAVDNKLEILRLQATSQPSAAGDRGRVVVNATCPNVVVKAVDSQPQLLAADSTDGGWSWRSKFSSSRFSCSPSLSNQEATLRQSDAGSNEAASLATLTTISASLATRYCCR